MKQTMLLLSLISFSGFGQKQVFGCYTNYSEKNNMFVTKIQLNEDGTFIYEFVGDLAHNWGDGIYQIDTDQVVMLKFGESDLDSIQRIAQSLSSGKEIFGTKFYAFKEGNLYPLKKDGTLIKRARLVKKEYCRFRNE
ncbi:hypothetical protein M3P19_09440 [Muricauda sp. 2012CJ35-5]|uniref:Uncharacterized protein n=1 Tax=Flagellimonas spongiicola TaxID=2942208 RepID=A0ABT0PS82_9FLAO|nr:hypothetical protein [Allomuricauda spongiicola]MCL6274233.1 hypothetical protein [Allomuricauda spongiicola]